MQGYGIGFKKPDVFILNDEPQGRTNLLPVADFFFLAGNLRVIWWICTKLKLLLANFVLSRWRNTDPVLFYSHEEREFSNNLTASTKPSDVRACSYIQCRNTDKKTT